MATAGESQNVVAVMSAMTAQMPGAKLPQAPRRQVRRWWCRARLACARPPALPDVLHHPRDYPRRESAAVRLATEGARGHCVPSGGARVRGLPGPRRGRQRGPDGPLRSVTTITDESPRPVTALWSARGTPRPVPHPAGNPSRCRTPRCVPGRPPGPDLMHPAHRAGRLPSLARMIRKAAGSQCVSQSAKCHSLGGMRSTRGGCRCRESGNPQHVPHA
jgi:hypothetical protein